jgi:alkaline phosphatase D
MAVFRRNVTRRRFLTGAAAMVTATVAKPYLSRASDRPAITHGLQAGDVSTESGVVWARTDRAARMLVEVATTDRFKSIHDAVFVDVLPESDLTAKVLIDGLPSGQDVFYRVRFQDHASPTVFGEPQVGHFRTAPADRRAVSFVWSGDTAGQGWGIDPARGGMRTFATMRANRPDFFIHCGDSIYADCPIERQLTLPNGELWRNVVTEEKAKVAETLAEFRGNYKYNLLDEHVRTFNAEVPILAQWDDHEVTNDWRPEGPITSSGYAETSALTLAARGNRAFREYMPVRETQVEAGRIYRKIPYGPLLDVFLLDMRSYRSGPDGQSGLFGARQLAWLKRELAASRAIWKVLAADLPIGLVSDDAIGQGDGAPAGREREVAGLLAFIRHAGIRNTLWITADMHYTAAHHYHPNRAVFQDFEPFWEFVSGPLHAGTWAPAPLDNTFGPRVMFAKGADGAENVAPCFGLQFFGHVAIDPAGVLTVTLKDVNDADLWSTAIEPAPERWSRLAR